MDREELEDTVLKLLETVQPFDTILRLLGEINTQELRRIKDALELETADVIGS